MPSAGPRAASGLGAPLGFGFNFSGPQYFRYRWHQATSASGQFEAEADLNGDGVADNAMQLGLHCMSGSCVNEPLISGVPELTR